MSDKLIWVIPILKKVNTPEEFTKDQILEYQKCAERSNLLYGKLCSYCIT